MVESITARHLNGKWSLGKNRADCMVKWPMDAGSGTNAKFPKILSREN